jgi:hypothetical protein
MACHNSAGYKGNRRRHIKQKKPPLEGNTFTTNFLLSRSSCSAMKQQQQQQQKGKALYG